MVDGIQDDSARELRPRLLLLDDDAIRDVHLASLRLLSTEGVEVRTPRALRLLEAAGAHIDGGNGIVKLPPDLVEWALHEAPNSIVLGSRSAGRAGELDSAFRTAQGGVAAHVLDHATGTRRAAVSHDLELATILADVLDDVSIAWPVVSPSDVPAHLQNLQALRILLEHTQKHIRVQLTNADEVPYAIEMIRAASRGSASAGSVASALYCSAPPRRHERCQLDAAISLAQQGIPIAICAMALAGGTGPMSKSGTLLQTNAEILSAITILQLAHAGCPVLYGASSGVLDMRYGTCGTAGPETLLAQLALTEMGRFYHLPVEAPGFVTDAKTPSFSAGADVVSQLLAASLCDTDIIIGMGMLDSSRMHSLVKLVLDAELAREWRRLQRGMPVGSGHKLVGLISRTPAGGQYLSAPETRRLLRSGEHWVPKTATREPYELWEARRLTEKQRAIKRLDEALASATGVTLEERAKEDIQRVFETASAELHSDVVR